MFKANYICNTCRSVFTEDEIYIKPGTADPDVADPDVGYNGEECCPYCKSDDFEEAFECYVCGNWFTLSECPNDICSDCLEREVTQDKLIACEKAHEDFKIVRVPEYFLWLLGDGGIIDALEEAVKARGSDEIAREYVELDPASFLRYRRGVSE